MNGTAHTPILMRPWLSGTQRIYRFPNGYGASVVNHQYAYGGLELAVIRYNSEDADDYELTYATPITDDVIGWLSEPEVEALLDQIAALPNPAAQS